MKFLQIVLAEWSGFEIKTVLLIFKEKWRLKFVFKIEVIWRTFIPGLIQIGIFYSWYWFYWLVLGTFQGEGMIFVLFHHWALFAYVSVVSHWESRSFEQFVWNTANYDSLSFQLG